ncbi:hypothetical protein GE09DRAFT_110323 [Coniochaeta sp. 2T2.1]|nr:hypothetical protein GE09DRAFT_110323 [Coniochaeta sp. 2T2.1]
MVVCSYGPPPSSWNDKPLYIPIGSLTLYGTCSRGHYTRTRKEVYCNSRILELSERGFFRLNEMNLQRYVSFVLLERNGWPDHTRRREVDCLQVPDTEGSTSTSRRTLSGMSPVRYLPARPAASLPFSDQGSSLSAYIPMLLREVGRPRLTRPRGCTTVNLIPTNSTRTASGWTPLRQWPASQISTPPRDGTIEPEKAPIPNIRHLNITGLRNLPS